MELVGSMDRINCSIFHLCFSWFVALGRQIFAAWGSSSLWCLPSHWRSLVLGGVAFLLLFQLVRPLRSHSQATIFFYPSLLLSLTTVKLRCLSDPVLPFFVIPGRGSHPLGLMGRVFTGPTAR